MGHSAGGHLALWAASRDRHTPGGPPRVSPRGVVSLAGVLDLRRGYRDDLGSGAVGELMGGGPEEVTERYRLGDPTLMVPASCPVTTMRGRSDDVVPESQETSYLAAARKAGGTARPPGGGRPLHDHRSHALVVVHHDEGCGGPCRLGRLDQRGHPHPAQVRGVLLVAPAPLHHEPVPERRRPSWTRSGPGTPPRSPRAGRSPRPRRPSRPGRPAAAGRPRSASPRPPRLSRPRPGGRGGRAPSAAPPPSTSGRAARTCRRRSGSARIARTSGRSWNTTSWSSPPIVTSQTRCSSVTLFPKAL